MKGTRSFHIFLILVFLVNVMILSVAVVPDYCQPPLNLSDCKLKPTPVFYYYKPGSRCEMALWRGCPTLNLFPDQYQCVDFCIYKMFKIRTEDNTAFDSKNSEYSCRDYLNTDKCSNKEESVYTYDPSIESCVEATWRGCPTVNKFPDESTCQKYCEPDYQDYYDKWREELDAMSEKDAESLNQMLDNMIDDEHLVNPQKLKATEPSIFEDDITEQRISTTTVATEGSTAKTLDTSTLKTVATSEATVKPTTESTTEMETVASSKATAKTVATSEATAKPTTESTTESKTVATSKATAKPTTESTTESKTVATSEATAKPTTESTTELKTVATSEATAKPTTESTTELKTVATSEATKPTTESTTKSRITDLPDEIQNIDYDI